MDLPLEIFTPEENEEENADGEGEAIEDDSNAGEQLQGNLNESTREGGEGDDGDPGSTGDVRK